MGVLFNTKLIANQSIEPSSSLPHHGRRRRARSGRAAVSRCVGVRAHTHTRACSRPRARDMVSGIRLLYTRVGAVSDVSSASVLHGHDHMHEDLLFLGVLLVMG